MKAHSDELDFEDQKKFEKASIKFENCLLSIRRAATLAAYSKNEEALQVLQEASIDIKTIWRNELRPLRLNLARVSDGGLCHGTGSSFDKRATSVHEKVHMLGVKICQLSCPPGWEVPTDLCDFLQVDLDDLHGGLQRERAKLQPQESPQPPAAGRKKGPSVNQRGLEMLSEDPERAGWTAEKWAIALKDDLKRPVSAAAVKQTHFWKNVMNLRALMKADRTEIDSGKHL